MSESEETFDPFLDKTEFETEDQTVAETADQTLSELLTETNPIVNAREDESTAKVEQSIQRKPFQIDLKLSHISGASQSKTASNRKSFARKESQLISRSQVESSQLITESSTEASAYALQVRRHSFPDEDYWEETYTPYHEPCLADFAGRCGLFSSVYLPSCF